MVVMFWVILLGNFYENTGSKPNGNERSSNNLDNAIKQRGEVAHVVDKIHTQLKTVISSY